MPRERPRATNCAQLDMLERMCLVWVWSAESPSLPSCRDDIPTPTLSIARALWASMASACGREWSEGEGGDGERMRVVMERG